jgi:xylulokinase
MELTILAIDIGTTSMKVGIFKIVRNKIELVSEQSEPYSINTYNDGQFCDIEPVKWINALKKICLNIGEDKLKNIDLLSISGTTPGITFLDKELQVIYPAILMLDQRSRKEAASIIDLIGEKKLLEETGNLPVPGGCSLASILWIKNNHPDIFNRTRYFAHSNTFLGGWLTGNYKIDPSSASLTALYNTARNDFSWNKDIADTFSVNIKTLPDIIPSYETLGRLKKDLAIELGLKKRPHVIIGGNDAVLAALSAGVKSAGDIININGTCEITMVCLPRCIGSKNYNVRAHVIEGKWLTLHVLNAGGKAYEWFHSVFCSEMTIKDFFSVFVSKALNQSFAEQVNEEYIPYLMGSRYSLEPLTASFKNINIETTREDILRSVTKSLCKYQSKHIKEISKKIKIKNKIFVTGGCINDVIIEAKKKWMIDGKYVFKRQSSLKGAALLAKMFMERHK